MIDPWSNKFCYFAMLISLLLIAVGVFIYAGLGPSLISIGSIAGMCVFMMFLISL